MRMFGDLAARWVRAVRSGSQERIKGGLNTQLGECFKFGGDAPEWHAVLACSRGYASGETPEGVLLEVSPGSNIALGIFPDWQSHPVAEMRAAGVAVCLSTDDPPYFNTTLTREYRELAHAHGWTAADFRAMNIAAMDHAFCDAETRAAMTQRLKEPAP